MDIVLLLEKITRTLRQHGVAATFRKIAVGFRRRGVADQFDATYGVDTSGVEPLWKFQIRSRNARFGVRYQPTNEQELVEAVSFLNDDPKHLTFIDLGCGKGRTLIVASKLGFRKIVGVEFARELVEIARANLSKTGVLNAEVIHSDAAEFRFPHSDFCLYLYNPFSHEVMRRVIENLSDSNAKRVFVLYSDPQCADLFDSAGFLCRLRPREPNLQIWTVVSKGSET